MPKYSGKSLNIAIAVFLILSVFGTARAWSILQSDPHKLIYFDPDSAQGNLARLKDEMNSFLRKHNLGIQAQPVAQIDAFEKLIAESPPAFIVVPHWYYEQKKDKEPLVPMMALSANGNPEYHKIIVVLKESKFIPADLNKKKIAMASVNRQEAYNLLADSLFKPHGLDPDSPQYILTSRDYDSLIALLLGKVSAAVVVKHSLTRLAEVNMAMVQRLKTIAESKPLPTPVLCSRYGQPDIDFSSIMVAMLSTSNQEEPEKFMQLLGFTGWIKITDTSGDQGGVDK